MLLLWLAAMTHQQHHLQVFVVDFGFTSDLPSRERNDSYNYVPFCGTADYASKDALNGRKCSAKAKS